MRPMLPSSCLIYHRMGRLVSFFLWVSMSWGEVLVLEQGVGGYNGTQDTSLYSENQNSNGGGKYLFAGRTRQLNDRRILIRFDLSTLPATAVIRRVTLTLSVSLSADNFGNVAHSLHRVQKNWGEGVVVAELPFPDESPGGSGAPANPGDATWISNFHQVSQWVQAGADFTPIASATAAVGFEGSIALWASAAMVEDLKAWFQNPEENCGWLIRGEESTGRRAKRFISSENIDAGARRPRLEIEYGLPGETVSSWRVR